MVFAGAEEGGNGDEDEGEDADEGCGGWRRGAAVSELGRLTLEFGVGVG